MALLEALARPFEPVDPAIARAELLSSRMAGWSSRDILDEVIHHEFPGRVALVSSFGAESAVLLHLVASVDAATPVVFIDTGKIFGSTHRYREEIVARLGLKDVRVARPDPALLKAHDTDAALWMRDPDKCCAVRKVAPLAEALGGFDALDRAGVVDGALALRSRAGSRARREHDRLRAADVGLDVVVLEVAADRLRADGLEVGRVLRVADHAAGEVPVGREQPQERARDLAVATGDENVHGAASPCRRGSAATRRC